MCTVTYIPVGGEIYITSNRDERRTRQTASDPAVYEGTTGRLLFPKDAQAGGTWIAVHDKGHALVLLNGAWERHSQQGPYRRSRGLILLDLADSRSPLQQFRDIDLTGIEPFTGIWLEERQLHECRWDGINKHHRHPDEAKPHIWSSVTLYDPEVIDKRKAWFREWIHAHPNPSQDEILRFHRFTGDGDPHNDLLMNRDGLMLTVSITSIRHTDSGAYMRYLDIPSRRTETGELQWVPGLKRQDAEHH